MILDEPKVDVTTSGLSGSKATIKATAKMFRILSSSLYQYKHQAIIREPSTNALDESDRFQVHLPTYSEPYLSFRDFGKGIPPEIFGEVYMTYFGSTKDDDEDKNGCLGLGTKSPLSLYQSFTVSSFIRGMKHDFFVYLDELGEPCYDHTQSTPTDEPDGLLVMIATGEDYRWQEAAKRIYPYFDTMPEINDQSIIDYCNEVKYDYVGDGYKLGSSITDTCYARMMNVAYPIPHEYRKNLPGGYIDFESGELAFTPGRETLEMTEKTVENLVCRIEDTIEKLHEDLKKDILNEPSLWNQVAKRKTILSTFDWADEKFFQQFSLPKLDEPIHFYNRDGKFERQRVRYDNNLVVDPDKEDMKKINHWRKKHHSFQVIPQKLVDDYGIPEEYLATLPDVPEVVRKVTERSRAKIFKVGQDRWGSDEWQKCEVDLNEEFVYVEINRFKARIDGYERSLSRLSSMLGEFEALTGQSVEIYGIKSAKVKQKRFQKSKGIELTKFLKRELASKKFVFDEEPHWSGQSVARKFFPDLRKQLDNIRKCKYHYIKQYLNYEVCDKLAKKVEAVNERYPLLNTSSPREVNEEYIEAIDLLKGDWNEVA